MHTSPVLNNAAVEVLHEDEHDHDNDKPFNQRSTLTDSLLQEINTDISKPIKRVYDHKAAKSSSNEMILFPSFERVRSKMFRARQRVMPPIPHCVNDLVIPPAWRKTRSGKNFFLHQNNDSGLLVYAGCSIRKFKAADPTHFSALDHEPTKKEKEFQLLIEVIHVLLKLRCTNFLTP